jgi:hypothetical protein|tara:strand:- start:704 stop:871 length:168 start_codon:yes stop_codon:yes gene_type:complete
MITDDMIPILEIASHAIETQSEKLSDHLDLSDEEVIRLYKSIQNMLTELDTFKDK